MAQRHASSVSPSALIRATSAASFFGCGCYCCTDRASPTIRQARRARLRKRLITLSDKPRRYGYRMLHAKLDREGFRVNAKVVARIYREECLNQHCFSSIGEAREILEDWRIDDKTQRLHSSLK